MSNIYKEPIMGKSKLKKSSIVKYVEAVTHGKYKINCSLSELVDIFYEEAEIEGVRGDLAFCQSLNETGFFSYGGIVLPSQNNFAGIGALDGNSAGKCQTFSSPRIGARAQIQHLKAYGSKEPLKQSCVDPRFKYVTRGCALTWEHLGIQENPRHMGWASKKGYGKLICSIYDTIVSQYNGLDNETEVSVKPEKTTKSSDSISKCSFVNKSITYNGTEKDVELIFDSANNRYYIALADLKEHINVNFDNKTKHISLMTQDYSKSYDGSVG